jgi:hypothetical protein
MPTEQHRRERGHDFYPPAADLARIPALYATEDTPTAAKTLHLHYFVRDCDWWIAELDPDTGLAFGYACLHGDSTNAEWGYIDLDELESLYQPAHIQTDDRGRPARILPHLIVERDLHWTPQPAGQVGLPGWRASA